MKSEQAIEMSERQILSLGFSIEASKYVCKVFVLLDLSSVGIHARIYGKKIRKTRKKEHVNLTWFCKLSTFIGTGKRTFIMYQIRVP